MVSTFQCRVIQKANVDMMSTFRKGYKYDISKNTWKTAAQIIYTVNSDPTDSDLFHPVILWERDLRHWLVLWGNSIWRNYLLLDIRRA